MEFVLVSFVIRSLEDILDNLGTKFMYQEKTVKVYPALEAAEIEICTCLERLADVKEHHQCLLVVTKVGPLSSCRSLEIVSLDKSNLVRQIFDVDVIDSFCGVLPSTV